MIDYNKYRYPKGNLMEISIQGIKSKKMSRLISRAIEFYCTRLMNKRTVSTLEVLVEAKNKLDNNVLGLCYFDGYSEGVREFILEIKKKVILEDLLTTIAHECVHIKQFAKRELKDGRVIANSTIWKGSEINELKVDYEDLPWEIEAVENEYLLFQEFIESELNSDRKRDILKLKVL
jgi:hypothetical protein